MLSCSFASQLVLVSSSLVVVPPSAIPPAKEGVQPRSWEQYHQFAATVVNSRWPQVCQQMASSSQASLLQGWGSEAQATDNGNSLWRWALSLELFHLSAAGLDWNRQSLQRYTGRGGPVTSRQQPAIREPPRPLASTQVPPELGPIERLAWTARVLIARLLRIEVLGSSPGGSVWTAALELLALSSQHRGDYALAWSSLPAAVSCRLRPLFAQLALSTLDGQQPLQEQVLNSLVDEVADRARHTTDNAYKAKQQAWRRWVNESLSKGAGAAYKWTNRPNNPRPNIATTAQQNHDPQEVAEFAAAG